MTNRWIAGATSLLSEDAGILSAMQDFKPDAVVVDSLFVAAAYVALELRVPLVRCEENTC